MKKPSPVLRPQNTYVSDRLIVVALKPHGIKQAVLPAYLGDVYSPQQRMRAVKL